MIRYYSTRDLERTLVSFEDALLAGLAPDGGLYVPDAVPRPDPALWRGAESFAEVGVNVLGAWLGDEIPAEVLSGLVRNALDFPVPVVRLSETLFVLELFHGPTRSFKDVGARVMARLMQRALMRRGERRVILVATSGDTGSAVADGFAGMDSIEVVLLYPEGKVSAVQERQLTLSRPGVRTLAVAGDFDDCQRLVKGAFTDLQLRDVPLSSANSINIGRLLPQTIYYLWALREVASFSREVSSFSRDTAPTDDGMLPPVINGMIPPVINGMIPPVISVPSGNLGNLSAAVLASLMGESVGRFVAAHNANDYFPGYLGGIADAFAFAPTRATRSNAMDVGAPSNFERLHHLLNPDELRRALWGTSVDDAATLERMNLTYSDYGYFACPHTAVGLEALARFHAATDDPAPAIAVATAHPAKFPEAVREALGMDAPEDETLQALLSGPTEVRRIPPTPDALREVLLEDNPREPMTENR